MKDQRSKIKIATIIPILFFLLALLSPSAAARADVIAQTSGSETNNIVNVPISSPVSSPYILLTDPSSLTPTPAPVAQPPVAVPANNVDRTTTDINSSSFRLVVCDGPDMKGVAGFTGKNPDGSEYIPCDFKGIMSQLNHLLTVAIVAGILVAIGGFCYAGYLYMTGIPSKISHAHKIFSNVAIGFIIMLSAWFIVYQILSWLTGNSGFGKLLGTP